MTGAGKLWREWRQAREFHALPAAQRAIVFYAEDKASWNHLGPVARALIDDLDREVCYLTSDLTDPILKNENPNPRTFAIGDGMVRTSLFMGLRAGVMVMTVPDLETFHLKRSRVQPVHYVYAFHSMVSTHMIYREHAFDHFDTIMSAGPHHVREIRETEAAYGLSPKNLIEAGYPKLDTLLRQQGCPDQTRGPGGPVHVLVAPSWGPAGLLENHAVPLVQALLAGGYRVTVRPHPETGRHHPEAIREMRGRFENERAFTLETNIASSESLRTSDLMISDFSGAALEYAFAFKRPVLFVDVPRKVNNPHYRKIPSEPVEVGLRSRIGEVVAPDRLEDLPAAIDRLSRAPHQWAEAIEQVRRETVFNIGRSATVGAEHIARLADELARDTSGNPHHAPVHEPAHA